VYIKNKISSKYMNTYKIYKSTITPLEFDISEYIVEGKNKIAVEVYRWCDASWLEDQDFWRLSVL